MSDPIVDGEELGADNLRPHSDETPSLDMSRVREHLGLSRNSVMRLVEKGLLPMYKNPITGRILFKISDIDRLKVSLNTYKRV